MIVRREPPLLRIRGLSCPRCAGMLEMSDGDPEAMRCAYCGHNFLDWDDEGIASFAPTGRLGRRRALRALRDALSEVGVRGHVVEEARRFHLPFWYLEAKLVGWQRYRKKRAANREQIHPLPESLGAGEEIEEESFGHNIIYSTPACDLRDFGLLGVAGRTQRLSLRPFELEAVASDETVCAVLRSRSVILRRARLYHAARVTPKRARHCVQRILLVRPRMRLIYYPVWRLRYRARGLAMEAAVDGLRPQLLRGSYPQREGDRLSLWIGSGGLSGLAAGVSPTLAVAGTVGWVLWRLTQDSVSGRRGELGAWLRRQVGGKRITIKSFAD